MGERRAGAAGDHNDPRSSASRRLRALAHLSPIFDLHLYRARNPSGVEFVRYDLMALVQLAVDTVALSSGMDGELGVARARVIGELAGVAAKMAPDRSDDEHAHIANHVLDFLLRHGQASTYFTVTRADPDDGWRTVSEDVRILYETLGADEGSLLVNVDTAAVNLLLIATNRTLEDEHEAAIAIMKAQLATGRLGDAVESATDALTLSRTYASNVKRMLADAERDVTRVDYRQTLRPELVRAHDHITRRIDTDAALLRHLEGLRADASEESDPDAARQLGRVVSQLSRAVHTLADLQAVIVDAAPRWRSSQAAQAFTAAPATEINPLTDVLEAALAGRPQPTSGAPTSPPWPALALDLTATIDRLTTPKRRPAETPTRAVDTDLEDAVGIYRQFPEQYHAVADQLRHHRIPPGTKARLSDLLDDADRLMAAEVPVRATLAELAGSVDVARRRLRLLLALDAMMLWSPDATSDDDWWATDGHTRADADELDIPDLVIHHAHPSDAGDDDVWT